MLSNTINAQTASILSGNNQIKINTTDGSESYGVEVGASELNFGDNNSNENGNLNLERIAELQYLIQKLELERTVAQLYADIDKIETGASEIAEESSPPPFPVEPTLEERLFNSIQLSSIYGSKDNLNAEIISLNGKMVGKEGSVIPTGEKITKITPTYIVIVDENGSKRTLSPSSGSSSVESQQASLPSNAISVVEPFDPSELLGGSSTINIPRGAPVGAEISNDGASANVDTGL